MRGKTVYLTDIKFEKNLRPRLSMRGLNQVTKTVLELELVSWWEALDASGWKAPSSLFYRRVKWMKVIYEQENMVALLFIIPAENLEQREMTIEDNEQK